MADSPASKRLDYPKWIVYAWQMRSRLAFVELAHHNNCSTARADACGLCVAGTWNYRPNIRKSVRLPCGQTPGCRKEQKLRDNLRAADPALLGGRCGPTLHSTANPAPPALSACYRHPNRQGKCARGHFCGIA